MSKAGKQIGTKLGGAQPAGGGGWRNAQLSFCVTKDGIPEANQDSASMVKRGARTEITAGCPFSHTLSPMTVKELD